MAFVPSSPPRRSYRWLLAGFRSAPRWRRVSLVKFRRDFHERNERAVGSSRSRREDCPRERGRRNKPEEIEADLLFPETKSLKSILKYCDSSFPANGPRAGNAYRAVPFYGISASRSQSRRGR